MDHVGFVGVWYRYIEPRNIVGPNHFNQAGTSPANLEECANKIYVLGCCFFHSNWIQRTGCSSNTGGNTSKSLEYGVFTMIFQVSEVTLAGHKSYVGDIGAG